MSNEEWRIIAAAPDYEISSHGRVRRATDGKNTEKGRLLKPSPDKDGYLQFTAIVNKRRKVIKIHRAVLLAFKGPPPTSRHLSSHEDGVNNNNFIWNLEWRIQAENINLKIKHGTHGLSLNLDQVRSIRAMAARGLGCKEISDFHSVGRSAVAHIVKRRCWAHDYS